jgi:signal peptidase I
MSILTAIVLIALALYVVAMILGTVAANFELLLFVCTVVTFVYWVAELGFFRRQRRAAFDSAVAKSVDRGTAERTLLTPPWWVEYTASFFPVVLFVFALRSFAFEPFRIPSDSMVPTLEDGDLILVKKYAYGVRLPLVYSKIVETGTPQRGDVVVFRFPPNPQQDYIKRVVGLPGDRIEYTADKRLLINGTEVEKRQIERYFYEKRVQQLPQYIEKLGGQEHRLSISDRFNMALDRDFAHTDPGACVYAPDRQSLACTVPAGKYFVMGDNRDNSQDSRIWGFVPAENIKGRAFFIWMNFGNIGRVGGFN